jgi:hypothetical protein
MRLERGMKGKLPYRIRIPVACMAGLTAPNVPTKSEALQFNLLRIT